MNIEERIQEFLEKLTELEEEYDVSVYASAGSYGGSRLKVRDNKSGEDFPRE